MHIALMEEIKKLRNLSNDVENDLPSLWEAALTNCFVRINDEVGGIDPIAPDTVGSTSIVAMVCSSHIVVANCGDSRAVLCRGKEALPLSFDHKVQVITGLLDYSFLYKLCNC